MAHESTILAQTLRTQRRIGRLCQHDHGLSLKAIAADSGIPYQTVRSYFGQAKNVRLAELPITALIRLVGVIPDELLDQLLAPADRHLEHNPDDDDADLDDLADAAGEVEELVRKARHPRSPGGTEIIAIEEERIRRAARKLARRRAA